MQNSQSSLIARSDTMLGVCHALGEDFGISANWFRVAFATVVVFNVEFAVGGYLAAGVLVAISRFLVRTPRSAADPVEAVMAEPTPVQTPVVQHAQLVAEAA